MEKHNFSKTLKLFFVCCTCAIMLFLCFFVPYTISWLADMDDSASVNGNSVLPNPTIDFYNGNTLLNSAYSFTSGNAGNQTPLNIHLKNTTHASDGKEEGAARILARVFYSIYVNKDVKEIATTKYISSVSYGDLCITHEHLPNTFSGYLFIDAAIEPESYIRLFKNIVPTAEGANLQMSLELSGEALLYEGNPYSVGELDKLPWKSYPQNWLNVAYAWQADFESFADGSGANFTKQLGAEGTASVVTVADAPVGNKVLSFTPKGSGSNNRTYRNISIKQGYNYRCSFYYKSSVVYSRAIHYELNGNGYSWDGKNKANTSTNGDWDWLYLETGLLNANAGSNTSLYVFAYTPINVTSYIDYVRVERIAGSSTPV